MVDAEIKNIRESVHDIKDEVKMLRMRTHKNENDVASNFAILKEIQTNATWIISELDDITKKIKEIVGTQIETTQNLLISKQHISALLSGSERIEIKISDLNKKNYDFQKKLSDEKVETLQEKITYYQKIRAAFFSTKSMFVILVILYVSDKVGFAYYFDKIRGIL